MRKGRIISILQAAQRLPPQKIMQNKERGEREAIFYSRNSSKRPKSCPDRIDYYNYHKKDHIAKDYWTKGDSKKRPEPIQKEPRKGQYSPSREHYRLSQMAIYYLVFKKGLEVKLDK